MGQPAAKQGDKITGTCTHTVVISSPPGTAKLPGHLFSGNIDGSLSTNVRIAGLPAATQGSTATNTPAHVHLPPGTSFSPPVPDNQATIMTGSATVRINGKPAARNGDKAKTCDELPVVPGTVQASGTVSIGG